ncbi:unnamed protein product [Bursaphelenchus xylophilus]|uniref:(pine wood nematode) hypothetical protein n=1 Tax=Bursaphelenchus xylophilus TaxID=6326 RepID=A0A1I7S1W4_BURXY|nr:unnamed protein product [Bursaphelenchus xylophilus]CAG9090035.1 unnamed protein product [Bursaphelenchus xylophilus]
MNTNIKVDRQSGVLHRVDSQIFPSNLKFNQVEMVRCPACRLQSQLMCPSCVCTNIRANKLREVYREWFLRKAEICRKIEQVLEPRMKLEADFYAKKKSVKLIRQKIEAARDNIQRLKKKIAVVEVRRSKCEKNVRTLEKKSVSHSKRIQLQNVENDKLRAYLKAKREDTFRYVRFYTSLFSHYIPIDRFAKENKTKKKVGDAMASMMATDSPAVQQWPPVKKYYYTVNGCAIEDNCEYDRLLDDLLEGVSIIFLEKHSKHAYSALLYTIRLVNVMALFADLLLPYHYDIKDFALYSNWSQDLFFTDMFKLNVNILALCAVFGLKNEQIKISQPFHNLYNLVHALLKKEIDGTDGLINEKMKHQIFDAFCKFVWEERNDRLEVDNVEEDWVNVGFSVK